MKLKITYDGKTDIISANANENLLKVLQKHNYPISADCGGSGKCGKCKVIIQNDNYNDTVLACKTIIQDDIRIMLPTIKGYGLISDKKNYTVDKENGVGLVLDIGTTTLVFYFVDLKTGYNYKTSSKLNPQKKFGADVISRISYAKENGTDQLSLCLQQTVNEEISKFYNEFHKQIDRFIVTGNTVMLHIFDRKDITAFGEYPFTPKFLNLKHCTGKKLGYNADNIIILPSFSSFVGADIVCGAIATEMFNKKNALLIDLGTNGEMILSYNGKYYTTSVAAGPAFEGADIECGTGGIDGAICNCYEENGTIKYNTINNKPACGICGSGLIDAVTFMLQNGIINDTGAFMIKEDKFFISENIFISSKDIRKFQLAKSAVRSGLDILIKKADAKEEEIKYLYIAGGLGYNINKNNALLLGLFPAVFRDKIVTVGNTAGIGAKMCLLNKKYLSISESLAVSAQNIELSNDSEFNDEFMENMFFYGNNI